jgi:hypothetical protein
MEGLSALEAAYALLMEFADNISDPEQRRAYLHDIDPGRGIWADYERYFDGKSLDQVEVVLPRSDAPTGRPLREDEWVPVQWTLSAPEDERISGKTKRRKAVLLRLLTQAEEQGAAPTIADLAAVLNVSLPTIKRDLAALRKQGHTPKTRGTRT